jgi:competence protein ComEC
MHRSIFPFLLSCAPFCSLVAQEPIQFTVSQDVASCLKVRARPESDAPDLGCLSPGTRIEAVGIAPYWRRIRLPDGRTGWAAKKFLDIVPAVLDSAIADADSAQEAPGAELKIHVVDVGQGDGIWIYTFDDNIPGNGRYEGYNIIIDGGPPDATSPLLSYVMANAHQGAVIDALIITHPHYDHYPGAKAILERFEVREFYESGFRNDVDWDGFRQRVAAERFEGRPIIRHSGLANFGIPDWGRELKVSFLYAETGQRPELGRAGTGTRINNSSIVFRIQYGTQSMLFVGDLEGKERNDPPSEVKYGERLLLDSVDSTALRSTVLKVAHHGSETSSTARFIEAVDPHYVVVSSGRRDFDRTPNLRFLPDTSTLQRYCDHADSIRIYRTDQDDEGERKTEKTDADGDHIVITMTAKETRIQPYSGGNPISPTACVP